MWVRLGSNTLANILTGGSAMALQLGLTALAARSFDAQTFSVWTLAMSMAGLAPLFAINLSAVVTRQLVSAYTSDGDAAALIMAAARRLGRALALVGLVAIVLSTFGLHHASSTLAATDVLSFVIVALVLTLGQLWQITIQPALGWHFAREQNWPVVGAYLLVRVCALIAMWLASRELAGNLLATAVCLALGYWVGVAAANAGSFRAKVAAIRPGPELRRQLIETLRLVRWFALWSICMVAIQYSLPQLMSILGAAHYNAFYFAYSLNLALSGVVSAIGSAMLAPITRVGANQDRHTMVQLLTCFPIVIALVLIAVLLGLRLAMPFVAAHWSRGVAGASDINVYLFLLGLQTIARSLSAVFGIVLASRATALRLVGPQLLELALALLIALPLGSVFGERAFLLALAGAGVIAALSTAAVGVNVSGLQAADRWNVWLRFLILELAALVAWWLLAS